jgi:hypothetical protein
MVQPPQGDHVKDETYIRRAQSSATDAIEAVREFHAAVAQTDMALVIFFCSGSYDLALLAREMHRLFDGVQVVGCTTAGEIGPAGYHEHSLCGVSFSASGFSAVSGCLEHLQQFTISTGNTLAQTLLQRLEGRAPQADASNSFAFLLIDGMSVREEPVTRALQGALGGIQLAGGSAGDGLNFGITQLYFEGHFRADSALLVLVNTQLPFLIFKTQHFVATDERMVVTEADPAHRMVMEINGLPAAPEYARLLGIDASELNPTRFAACPVVVVIDGVNYVRSIQKVNPDGSLSFFCAIENGLVLRVAKGVDLLENLTQAFARVQEKIGPPQLVLGFDCILRKLEIAQTKQIDRLNQVLADNQVIGFNTYGEQFHGVHLTQTFVGIAFGTNTQELTRD